MRASRPQAASPERNAGYRPDSPAILPMVEQGGLPSTLPFRALHATKLPVHITYTTALATHS